MNRVEPDTWPRSQEININHETNNNEQIFTLQRIYENTAARSEFGQNGAWFKIELIILTKTVRSKSEKKYFYLSLIRD